MTDIIHPSSLNPHPSIGPVYCETGHGWLFMAEPVNTLSNLVIIAAAVFAFLHVRRSTKGWPPDLMLLTGLLLATGIGSFFWHALRTRTALVLDWLPGVLFLMSFILLWLRALHGWIAGIAALLFVTASAIGIMMLARSLAAPLQAAHSPLVIVPFFTTLLVIGGGFAGLTWRARGREAGVAALGLLGLGAAGAFFRSTDMIACPIIPTGTHFLWHVFLSAAAYCCIRFLLKMKDELWGMKRFIPPPS